MANEFEIEGAAAAMAKIRSVRQDVAFKGVRAAAMKAMRIVRDAARAKAKVFDDPETKSNIASKIVTRYDSKASRREEGVVVKVGVQGGARPAKGTSDEGHWRLLEFGAEHMRAQPFMRSSLEDNIEPVTSVFVSEIDPQIEKALAKAMR